MTQKVLILSEHCPPVVGGSSVWVGKIAEHWPGQAIVMTGDRTGLPARESCGAAEIRPLPWSFPSWAPDCATSIMGYLRWIVTALVLGLRHQVDLVFCGRGVPEGVIARIVCGLLGRPYAVLAHGEEITTCLGSRSLSMLLRFAYSGARCIIANSSNTAKLVSRAGGADGACRVVPPGVDAAKFCQTTGQGRSFQEIVRGRVVLSVGRLYVHKNYVGVTQAVGRLVRQGCDVTYLVAGTGPCEGAIRDAAKTEGIPDRVHLLGEVSNAELITLYRAADVFALPGILRENVFEGFGIVFLEAAAAGKPSIAGNSGGSGEAVLDGRTGYVVDGRDVGIIEDRLRRLLDDDALRTSMGAAAQARVRAEFDWPIVLRKLYDTVEEVMRL